MMENGVKAKDKHWMKLLDPFKNDTTELTYGIVVAEANFDLLIGLTIQLH